MSIKNELLVKLRTIADAPDNEFDKIIHDNRDVIELLDETALSAIYMLRRKSIHLCDIIPYSREEIDLLVESGCVSEKNRIAELCDCFSTADYIFAKAKGEKI